MGSVGLGCVDLAVGVGAEWMLCVETRTPGTSVMELRGPGGWRPCFRDGRRSRTRRRGEDKEGEGAVGVEVAIGIKVEGLCGGV